MKTLVVSVLIVLVHLGSVQMTFWPTSSSHKSDEVTLGDFVSNNADLTKRSQLESLMAQAMRNNFMKPAEYVMMLSDFNKLANQIASDNICSLEVATHFHEYYVEYIDKSEWDPKVKKMPNSLRKLVIAYGMQMNNLCKENMLRVLMEEDNDLLAEEDVARMGIWLDEEGPLRQVLEKMNEPGEIILPTDLATVMSRNDKLVFEKMYIQSDATSHIRLLKETCEKRFQPVYDPLFAPLIILANLAFGHQSDQLKAEFKKAETQSVVGKWSNIVFLCEALKMVEPVDFVETLPDGDDGHDEDDGQADDVDHDDGGDFQPEETTEVAKVAIGERTVRLLTKEEADSINEQIRSSQELGHRSSQTNNEVIGMKVFERKFAVRMDDLVVNKTDSKLMKSVASFRTNRSKMEIVKDKLKGRALSTIWKMIKKREVKIVATAPVKAMWRRLKAKKANSPEDSNVTKEVLKMVQEMKEKSTGAWSQQDKILFSVLLLCALAALALVGWAVGLVILSGLSVGAALSSLFAG